MGKTCKTSHLRLMPDTNMLSSWMWSAQLYCVTGSEGEQRRYLTSSLTMATTGHRGISGLRNHACMVSQLRLCEKSALLSFSESFSSCHITPTHSVCIKQPRSSTHAVSQQEVGALHAPVEGLVPGHFTFCLPWNSSRRHDVSG